MVVRQLPEMSFDAAMRNMNINQRVITALQKYIANANQDEIRHITFVLGEEDHNLLLLTMVERAIQERATQIKYIDAPSLIASQEFVEAAKAWSSKEKIEKRRNAVQELVFSLLETKYPPESKMNIVKAYLATGGKKDIPDSIKQEIADLPGAKELFNKSAVSSVPSERKKPLTLSGATEKRSADKENRLNNLNEESRTSNPDIKIPKGPG